jgi:phosphate transport system substrate-binding protein
MKKIIAAAAIAATFATGVAQARTHISIVGSSTVFPFATAVAEAHGRDARFKSPVVESTGTGGGMKIFCQGMGHESPDVTMASRKVKQAEIDMCAKSGITMEEHLIGFDGIVFANDKDGVDLNVTLEQLYKAVAKTVYQDGKFIPNPYTRWNQIDSSLPDQEIAIMIPPSTSGTRDAFVESVMHQTCKKKYGLPKKGADGYKANCTAAREDGEYVVQMGENDNLTIKKLGNDKKRFGIFGFSFLDQNGDKVKGAVINGASPTFDAIADGKV